METICYVSVHHKSDWEKLKAHFKYLSRPSSFPVLDLSPIEVWEERVACEKNKRHDARLATTLVLALPNDRKEDLAFFSKVKLFLAKFFDVDLSHIDYAVHRNDDENIHMHVVMYPRRRDGKKIDPTPYTLRKLRLEWERFLREEGYTVRYIEDVEKKTGHLGYKTKNKSSQLSDIYPQM